MALNTGGNGGKKSGNLSPTLAAAPSQPIRQLRPWRFQHKLVGDPPLLGYAGSPQQSGPLVTLDGARQAGH
jgi:hypothetical protein